MVSIVAVAVIPPLKFGKYMGIISSVFAFSGILSPLLGGAINDHTTWRWVFWLKYVLEVEHPFWCETLKDVCIYRLISIALTFSF
jgi:MFS family permease